MNYLTDTKCSLDEIIGLFISKNEKKDFRIKDGFAAFMMDKEIHQQKGTYNFYKEIFPRVNSFFEAKGIINFSQLSSELLNEFAVYCKARKNKSITINKKIKVIIALVHYAESKGMIPLMGLKFKYLKEAAPQIGVVPMSDMEKVLTYSKNLSLSSQAMILLFFTTGIRPEELIHIEVSNINFENMMIYLTKTKNGDPRYIPMVEELEKVIKALIKENEPSKWLFPKKESPANHVSTEASRSLIARIKKALNIDILSACKLRHLYATTLLRKGANIKTVAKLLGHKTTRITERYLDLTETEIMETARIFNPITCTNSK